MDQKNLMSKISKIFKIYSNGIMVLQARNEDFTILNEKYTKYFMLNVAYKSYLDETPLGCKKLTLEILKDF
jgi:hypothetical protein